MCWIICRSIQMLCYENWLDVTLVAALGIPQRVSYYRTILLYWTTSISCYIGFVLQQIESAVQAPERGRTVMLSLCVALILLINFALLHASERRLGTQSPSKSDREYWGCDGSSSSSGTARNKETVHVPQKIGVSKNSKKFQQWSRSNGRQGLRKDCWLYLFCHREIASTLAWSKHYVTHFRLARSERPGGAYRLVAAQGISWVRIDKQPMPASHQGLPPPLQGYCNTGHKQ
jgi:hypothetical protein